MSWSRSPSSLLRNKRLQLIGLGVAASGRARLLAAVLVAVRWRSAGPAAEAPIR